MIFGEMVVFILWVGVVILIEVDEFMFVGTVELVVGIEVVDPELEKSEFITGVCPKSWLEGVPHVSFTSPKLLKPLSVLNELFWWELFVLLTTPAVVDADGIVVVVIVVVVVTVVVVVLLFPVDIVSIFVVLTVAVVFGIVGGTTITGAGDTGAVGAVPGRHIPIAGSR